MKLRELLQQLGTTSRQIGVPPVFICGGVPRDKYMKHLDNIADLDLTNGSKTVNYLSQQFYEELRKKYNVARKTMEDGHSTIFIGSLKMDFSSNFMVHNIDHILGQMGITNPTNMQREMYSRDFTCNSLLMTLDLKQILDPLKRGFRDIEQRKIRTCLAPDITLTSNRNRVVRAIYLACKLDFDLDESLVSYIKNNPQVAKISTEKSMKEKLGEAFKRDGDKASYLINKMGLWNYIPIIESAYPYYQKHLQGTTMPKKSAYFQGGGGINEPAPPGEKKYPVDKAITVQPRFIEPFYRNYDYLDAGGVDGEPKHGPGSGYAHMNEYKNVKEFLEFRRKRLQGRYVAEDSWIEDTLSNYRERANKMKIRSFLLSDIIKTAFTSDDNDIDFPIDDEVNRQDQMIYPEEDEYQIRREKGDKYQFPSEGSPLDPGELNISMTTPQIAGEHSYLPDPDFEGKSDNGSRLDFGRDYTEETLPGRPSADEASVDDLDLDQLEAKYLESTEMGLFGLPDGVDPEGHDADGLEQVEQPYDTVSDIGTQIYDDKWNI